VTDPYRQGLDILAQTGAVQDRRRNLVAEVAPEFARIAIGFTYGDIMGRPGLALNLRQLAAIAATAAIGTDIAELRAHVSAALHLGWTKSEIIEILIQVAAHAGITASMQALAGCHDLLVEMDPQCASCDADSSGGQL